ncbi:MAG: TenA family transcriptional regulator [Candidatus Calditenuis sp.]|nr:TenA family transcriptional regulator [Candidatus Calditenuis sp.]
MNARELLAEVRKELEPLNSSVLNCRFLLRAERGELSFGDLRSFVENQLYIVSHDAKSIALMAARATHAEESAYFADLARADLEALGALEEMAEELGATKGPVHSLKVIPHAVDYTHFLAFLAAHRNPGEQAFALIVNLPVWSAACARLLKAVRERYGLKRTGFLELFSSVPGWVEERGLQICERYVTEHAESMRFFARLIQSYELSFWEGLGGG